MDENEARACAQDEPVVFRLRTPILPILPALAVTLVLAGLVWLVT